MQSVNNVGCGDSFTFAHLCDGACVANELLQILAKSHANLVVDRRRYALNTTTAREAADGGLGHALDGVVQDLAVR